MTMKRGSRGARAKQRLLAQQKVRAALENLQAGSTISLKSILEASRSHDSLDKVSEGGKSAATYSKSQPTAVEGEPIDFLKHLYNRIEQLEQETKVLREFYDELSSLRAGQKAVI